MYLEAEKITRYWFHFGQQDKKVEIQFVTIICAAQYIIKKRIQHHILCIME